MERDIKIILGAILILFVAMISFSFINVSGKDITGQQIRFPKVSLKLPLLCPSSITCVPKQLIGDIDNDGQFSKVDVKYVNCIAKGITPLPSNLCCVDIPPNPDGQVNILDVQRVTNLYLRQKAIGTCSQKIIQPTGLVNTISIPQAPFKSIVQGNYLYLLVGSGFFIFDITNPIQPRQTAFFDYIPYSSGLNYDFDIVGEHVFITNSLDGIVTVDVSDKMNPNFVRNQFGAGSMGIKTSNDKVFVAADASIGISSLQPWGSSSFINGLQIFDRSPYGLLLGKFNNGAYCSNQVFASNNQVLLGTHLCSFVTTQPGQPTLPDKDITLLDITNIANPIAISSFSTSSNSFLLNGQPEEIYVKNDIGYIIQNGQLMIFDLSSSNPLKIISSYNAQPQEYTEQSTKVTVNNNNKMIVLILNTPHPSLRGTSLLQTVPGALDVVDVSNPRNPLIIGRHEIRNPLVGAGWMNILNNVEIKGDYAYVSDTSGFLHIVKWQ